MIAAVSVGSVTARLSTRARRSVYDLEEAVDFVADRLPPDLTAEISYVDGGFSEVMGGGLSAADSAD